MIRVLRLTIFWLIALLLATPLVVSPDIVRHLALGIDYAPGSTFQGDAAYTLFPYIVPKALFSRIVIELAFSLWLVLIIISPEHRPRLNVLHWALLATLLIMMASALVGVSFSRSLWSNYERMGGVLDWAHWAGLALVVSTTLRGWREWRILMLASLAVACIVAGVGMAEYFREGGRVQSTLGNPVYVGFYLMLHAIIGVGLAGERHVNRDEVRQN